MASITKTATGTTKALVGFVPAPFKNVEVVAYELTGTQATAAATFYENALAAGTVTTGASAGTAVKLGSTAAATACGAASGAYAVVEHLTGGGAGLWEAVRIASVTAGTLTLSAATTYSVPAGDKIYVTATTVATSLVSAATVQRAGDPLVVSSKPGRAMSIVLVSTSAKIRSATARI